jgi:hypothetical protein
VARSWYVAFSSMLSLAIFFASFFASLSSDGPSFLPFDFSLTVASLSASRLRFFFLSADFFAGSLSETEVAGVLVPEGAAEASVGSAELSESPSVPAIDSPLTKNPYRPPRLIPFFWIWLRVLWERLEYVSHGYADLMYLLAAANALQAVVERAHPPLVVGRVGCLLFAEAELILLMGDEERLLDAAALSVERVARALPSLLTQICFCVHCRRVVVSVDGRGRSLFPSASNFFVGCSWHMQRG